MTPKIKTMERLNFMNLSIGAESREQLTNICQKTRFSDGTPFKIHGYFNIQSYCILKYLMQKSSSYFMK